MHGVTTALVGFLFVCVVFPHLVKNRPQYYAAFAAVCLIILLDALGMMLSPTSLAGFRVFAYVAVAFLQVAAILLLFLSAGGIGWRQLAGEMREAIEVIRRGGEKELVIPLTAQPRSDQPSAERAAAAAPSAASAPPPTPTTPAGTQPSGGTPLEP
ncbi:hypothetical protein [Fontivita pretiosa]|uniref:hypothetical protein n=1 Tax=Fontivita pretiosa TaxID=2989684 RepID=UPI003D1716F3